MDEGLHLMLMGALHSVVGRICPSSFVAGSWSGRELEIKRDKE